MKFLTDENIGLEVVVFLRLDDERNANKIRALNKLIVTQQDNLIGNFVVVTETSVRVRQTPRIA